MSADTANGGLGAPSVAPNGEGLLERRPQQPNRSRRNVKCLADLQGRADVRFWHLADVASANLNVRS